YFIAICATNGQLPPAIRGNCRIPGTEFTVPSPTASKPDRPHELIACAGLEAFLPYAGRSLPTTLHSSVGRPIVVLRRSTSRETFARDPQPLPPDWKSDPRTQHRPRPRQCL